MPRVAACPAKSGLIDPGRDNKRLTFAADSKPLRRRSPVLLVSMTGTWVVLESLIDPVSVRDGNGPSLPKVGHHCQGRIPRIGVPGFKAWYLKAGVRYYGE